MSPSNKDKKTSKKDSNPSNALTVFIAITVAYIIFEHYLKYYTETDMNDNIYLFGYLATIFVVEFGINLSITKSVCREYQGAAAFSATILPWGLVFGTFVLLLSIMPGWLAPFSNTFGYSAALMYGLNGTLNKIFLSTKNETITKHDPLYEAISHIYSDRSLLINELTPENFEIFWKNMRGTFKENVFDNTKLYNELKSMVGLKYSVAKLIWYILIGVLVTSISYNSLLDTTCIVRASTVKDRDEYELKLAAEQAKAENQPTKREYKTK